MTVLTIGSTIEKARLRGEKMKKGWPPFHWQDVWLPYVFPGY